MNVSTYMLRIIDQLGSENMNMYPKDEVYSCVVDGETYEYWATYPMTIQADPPRYSATVHFWKASDPAHINFVQIHLVDSEVEAPHEKYEHYIHLKLKKSRSYN